MTEREKQSLENLKKLGKKIEPRYSRCPKCKGNRYAVDDKDNVTDCTTCNGSGIV